MFVGLELVDLLSDAPLELLEADLLALQLVSTDRMDTPLGPHKALDHVQKRHRVSPFLCARPSRGPSTGCLRMLPVWFSYSYGECGVGRPAHSGGSLVVVLQCLASS